MEVFYSCKKDLDDIIVKELVLRTEETEETETKFESEKN